MEYADNKGIEVCSSDLVTHFVQSPVYNEVANEENYCIMVNNGEKFLFEDSNNIIEELRE